MLLGLPFPRARRVRLCAALALLLSAPLSAAIRIEVEGVEGEVRGNVYAFLTMERFRYREDLTEDAVVRMYNRLDAESRSALRPFGFYSPQISTTIEPLDEGRNWRVMIRIDPGPPVLIESVEILVEGPGANDEVFGPILNQTVLEEGPLGLGGRSSNIRGALEGGAVWRARVLATDGTASLAAGPTFANLEAALPQLTYAEN